MSLDASQLRGAFTALITPFSDDGALDIASLRGLARRQLKEGIDGLVPCGTTGEAATMSEDECLRVIDAVADEAGDDVPVIAGTGSNNTAETVAFTRRVADIDNVDAALVVAPYYNKPGQPELLRHFRTVADRSELPIVLYNVPSRTGISLAADTVGRLAEHNQIIGIKEASADMVLDTAIYANTPDDFALLSGDDFTTFPLLAIGGQGCISVVANLDPGDMSQMCHAANDGDMETAREIHAAIQPLARSLFRKPNPIPVKAAANILGWCGPTLRGPLYEADEDFKETLENTLHAYGLT